MQSQTLKNQRENLSCGTWCQVQLDGETSPLACKPGSEVKVVSFLSKLEKEVKRVGQIKGGPFLTVVRGIFSPPFLKQLSLDHTFPLICLEEILSNVHRSVLSLLCHALLHSSLPEWMSQ